MPNNTANKLKFMFFEDRGQKLNEIEEFLKSKERDLDFDKIIPLNGRDPREVWNTKWNAYDIHKIRSEEWSLVYFFETAWNYPEPIIQAIMEKYPDVSISFTSACEGGWFALSITRDEDTGDIDRVEFTSELGNDADGKIRYSMFNALSL